MSKHSKQYIAFDTMEVQQLKLETYLKIYITREERKNEHVAIIIKLN